MKKQFFAQTNTGQARYFDTQDAARAWLQQNGGGIIKKRNAKTIEASGTGLGRVEHNPPLKVWGEVEKVDAAQGDGGQ